MIGAPGGPSRQVTRTIRYIKMSQPPNFFADFGKLISDIETSEFWGSLEFKFEKGRAVFCKKSETLINNFKAPAGKTGEADLGNHNRAPKNSH